MTKKKALKQLFRDNFLNYASYVIKERAIPDARDGLKPVQRRILWSLHEMDDGRYNKVANVIGHAMRYHPHGDQSIGAALVSLANRGYFIDRQGNFGNILTGDDASAPRYIECRLTDLARETMFNDRITETVPSYDGRNDEPVVLPAKIPAILLLGVEGIAVGMSTRVLPHNFQEVLRAQIDYLRGRDFQLYPDFPQGGTMDVEDYDSGRGRVRNRARIDKKGSKELVIRELAWGTTTESVIRSMEKAARKGKLKISSIDDYTADKVEIRVRLGRGVSQEEGLKRLYAHTDCEMSHSASMMVIREGGPVESTVEELLRWCTDGLVEILRAELKLSLGDLQDREHWLTLEQIFIENRIYKEIEECDTLGAIRKAVRDGLEPWLEQLPRELTEEDVERLLKLHIRRISRFDIESHREEVGEVRSRIKQVRKQLSNVKAYTVSYIEDLLEKYGSRWPRLTSMESFSDINVRKIARRNLKVGFDPGQGYVGTDVKGERTFSASEYDRIFVFLADGTYTAIPVEEKRYVDGDVVYCGVADRDRVFTVVYRDTESRLSYVKRFTTGGYIMEKEYRYIPEDGELMLFTERENMRLEFWFKRTKRMRKFKDSILQSEVRVTGSDAKGVRLGGKKEISSIKAVELDEEEAQEEEESSGNGSSAEDGGEGTEDPEDAVASDSAEEAPEEEPSAAEADEDDAEPGSLDEIIEEAERLRKRSSDAVRKAREERTGDLFED
ncbi:MAG: DNA topoisomerase IV subunit A [Candidatus Fermentibacteraceae bacterium]